MAGVSNRKSQSTISWQFVVAVSLFVVIVFFSFFCVNYVAPSVAVSTTQSSESVKRPKLDALTGSKPQLRSGNYSTTVVPLVKAHDSSVGEASKLCDSVELSVSTTIGVGSVLIKVHHDWAPLGAARFCELVQAKYYNDVRFFRVLKNFMAQVGMHGDPEVGRIWRKQNIKDDKVLQSNQRGRVTFAMAGPHTRTTQIFFNTVDNKFLDQQGFAPFASVESGMEYIDALYNKYGEGGRGDGKDHKGPNQGRVNQEGNEYLNAVFPLLSYIVSATIKS